MSMVMDPLSGHQAIGTATRPWTRPLMVDPPCGNQVIGMATNYVSQLRAGGPVIPGLLCLAGVEYGRNMHWVVTATRFTTVMNTISIYGWARTSLTERW